MARFDLANRNVVVKSKKGKKSKKAKNIVFWSWKKFQKQVYSKQFRYL